MILVHFCSGRRRQSDLEIWLHQLSDEAGIRCIVLSFDLAFSSDLDLMHDDLFSELRQLCWSGLVYGIVSGVPCTTWCRLLCSGKILHKCGLSNILLAYQIFLKNCSIDVIVIPVWRFEVLTCLAGSVVTVATVPKNLLKPQAVSFFPASFLHRSLTVCALGIVSSNVLMINVCSEAGSAIEPSGKEIYEALNLSVLPATNRTHI